MTPRRIACALAVFAVVCVLALFFCQGIEGPYSAVHGPVTALLSIRAAALVHHQIAQSGLAGLAGRILSACMALVPFAWTLLITAEFPSCGLSARCCSVLRC